MKKFLFILTALCVSVVSLFAQPADAIAQAAVALPAIPADPEVRIGKLDNGLTYYIRRNAKPEKQAEFYILHHVGAMQEDTTQIGLAHFLEHMAFNGTKNFPGKGIINYLEKIGVKFGANLNAGTGQEHTVYNMSSVPLLREGIVDSCLLILHDWSYFITIDPAEVDKERGVIIEELRQGNTAGFRTSEKLAPTIYNGTRYAYRNIIGTEAGLRSFDRQV
ncbi:MAG: insulinase family protein, partial [Rikenellaceae bacterium]|nr:insulinase family protein [Rikenellaceae bacterium]